MVPKDRIELSADPYQGSVLPLNYIGKAKKIILVLEIGIEPISLSSEESILSIKLFKQKRKSYSHFAPYFLKKETRVSFFTFPSSSYILPSSPSISSIFLVSTFA